MAESIIKINRSHGYAVVFRSVAQDVRLSLKARGLFLLMQSLPDDWSYSISGLAKKANTGKDTIRSALKELADVGYLVKEQAHDSGESCSHDHGDNQAEHWAWYGVGQA